jgi:cation:H+ antiporter
MLADAVSILAGLLALYAGAEGLVRGGSSLALRLGLTPLVVGLTVVAMGTSMPELVVSAGAALAGTGGIAAGNVVGSNIGNIGLILGVAALIHPLAVRAQVIRREVPILLLASAVLGLVLLDDRVGRVEGALLCLGIVAYVTLSLRLARRETAAEARREFADGVPAVRGSLRRDLLLLGGGLGVLVIGARLLVDGAVNVAETLGMSQAVIGLTVVSIGTSLPELATSAVAAARGEGDLAVGNVMGSNIFNILAILGAASLARPLDPTGIAVVDLGVMLGFSVALLPIMRSGFRIGRLEGGALILAYVGYLVYLLL